MEQTVKYKGFHIKIKQDEFGSSPDEDGNEDCFLVYDHRDFYVRRDGFSPDNLFEFWNKNPTGLYDGYHVIPVLAYIHSGVALHLGHEAKGFDTSFKGFALIKKQEGWAENRVEAAKIAILLIEEWNQYLSGEVYGYEIDESSDSCWRYYGDPWKSGLLDDAKASIDGYMIRKARKHAKYLKPIIKARIPIIYRKEFKAYE